MKNKLDILISIPHGGKEIPKELKEYTKLTAQEILEDIDAFSHDIFNMEDNVNIQIKNGIARTFIDVNRDIDDLPPIKIDGIVKLYTINMQSIFDEKFNFKENLIDTLIKKYHEPYHNLIKSSIKNDSIKIAFDCHTMAQYSPKISPTPGMERPLFCLSNNFGSSAPNEMLITLKNSICTIFNISKNEIKLNDPFSGGFITKNYGNKPIPWIQIEMNRKLYFTAPWFNSKTLKVDKRRIDELNDKFKETIKLFYNHQFGKY